MEEKEAVQSVVLNLENGEKVNLPKGIVVESSDEKLVKINIFNLEEKDIIQCLIGLESFLNEQSSKLFKDFKEEMEQKQWD